MNDIHLIIIIKIISINDSGRTILGNCDINYNLAKIADQKSLKTNQVSDSDPALTQSKSQQYHHEHPDSASRSKTASKPTERQVLKISLTKGKNGDWSSTSQSSPPVEVRASESPVVSVVNDSVVRGTTGGVVDNVSSFLSGIRASFRQDNVVVSGTTHEKKAASIKNKNGQNGSQK